MRSSVFAGLALAIVTGMLGYLLALCHRMCFIVREVPQPMLLLPTMPLLIPERTTGCSIAIEMMPLCVPLEILHVGPYDCRLLDHISLEDIIGGA